MTKAEPEARPRAAILELDGWRLRRLYPADVDQVLAISGTGNNRAVFDLPEQLEQALEFIGHGRSSLWGLPMLFLRGEDVCGFGFTGLPNQRSLNAFLLTVFRPETLGPLPAALYVRHIFWNFPVHRLYLQFPLVSDSVSYVEMYEAIGFRSEGLLAGYAAVAGEPQDVVVMGVLRRELESWLEVNEPRLAL